MSIMVAEVANMTKYYVDGTVTSILTLLVMLTKKQADVIRSELS